MFLIYHHFLDSVEWLLTCTVTSVITSDGTMRGIIDFVTLKT